MEVQLFDPLRDDAAALSRIHGECFSESWSKPAILALLSASGCFSYVLPSTRRPDGFIMARVAADEAEILTLAVRNVARRRGIGRALVQEAALHAERAGARHMFLEVGIRNSPALALYQTLGFETVGKRPAYYRRPHSPDEDALALRVRLPLRQWENRAGLG